MRIIHDDNRNAMRKLINEGVTVDLVVTSPPYDDLRSYNDSLEWNLEVFKEIADLLYEIITDHGIVVWIVDDRFDNGSKTLTSFKQALYFKEIGFKIHDVMIYGKKNPVPQIYHKRYTNGFEYMFILSKGTPNTHNPLMERCKMAGKKARDFKTIDGKRRLANGDITKEFKIKSNVWFYGLGGTNFGHPAIFPLDLAKDHVTSWSNEGDVVLDPFMGSGTVGVACQELNREFIGIEKVEKYYEIACNRINNSQKKLDDFKGES